MQAAEKVVPRLVKKELHMHTDSGYTPGQCASRTMISLLSEAFHVIHPHDTPVSGN